MNEDERLVRLFVVVPKTMGENDLRDHFNQFGDVDYVSIVRDRTSKESKGFAYIKYHRMSHAAKAFEACDRSFKPVFADPKPQKSGYQEGGERMGGPGSTASASTTASVSASYDMLTYMDTSHTNPEGNCRLSVVTSTSINQAGPYLMSETLKINQNDNPNFKKSHTLCPMDFKHKKYDLYAFLTQIISLKFK